MDETILVTGSAGFIGFHLCNSILQFGNKVVGVDCLTDYYDINLKKARLSILKDNSNFIEEKINISNLQEISKVFKKHSPTIVIHLAAQAGVRYSIDNPISYLNSNIVGTFNILECLKTSEVSHSLFASTSSVYGANEKMPFYENQKTDNQLSFYAASKKSCEIMSHSYSHIYNLPITNFRFFTVYGPFGRPDMALFKFVKAMKNNQPIDIYNNGEMKRDFTYIDDLVKSIKLLIKAIPIKGKSVSTNDTISMVAPWRVVNIGNSNSQNLMDFIYEIEKNMGLKAKKNFLPMQAGDVKETYANTELLESITGFRPSTEISQGVQRFCEWYNEFY